MHVHGGAIMFGSSVLEAAIGLCFIFVFVSLLSSAAREGVEALLKSRAQQLEGWIRDTLNARSSPVALEAKPTGDAATPKPSSKDWTADFYNHPLIFSTFKGSYEPGSRSLPSYIPPKQFAAALLDLIAPADGNKPPSDAGVEAKGQSTRALLKGVQDSAKELPPNLARVVLMAVDQADGELDKARAFVEDWYNQSMERVSGWYKRQTQLILFCFGLFAAACANVDAIAVTTTLMKSTTVRQELVALATKASSENRVPSKSDVDTMNAGLATLDLDIGWEKSAVKQLVDWAVDAWQAPTWTFNAKRLGEIIQTIFRSFFGWLVTACATMLGAAFWFDMLNKLVSLRSSIKPEDEKKKEA